MRNLRQDRRGWVLHRISRAGWSRSPRSGSLFTVDSTSRVIYGSHALTPLPTRAETKKEILLLPSRKTYSWSDKKCSFCTLTILLLTNCWGYSTRTCWFTKSMSKHSDEGTHTHVYQRFFDRISIPPLPIHIANVTVFIFPLINFADGTVCVLYPHYGHVKTNKGITGPWKLLLFFKIIKIL